MKTKKSHTPGPWELGNGDTIRTVPVGGASNGFFICDLAGSPNRVADAQIIIAAPDMLKALRSLTRALEIVDKDHPDWLYLGSEYQDAKAAIAKASGE